MSCRCSSSHRCNFGEHGEGHRGECTFVALEGWGQGAQQQQSMYKEALLTRLLAIPSAAPRLLAFNLNSLPPGEFRSVFAPAEPIPSRPRLADLRHRPENMGKHGHPTMPRVFIVRHGQTEWSLNGRHVRASPAPNGPVPANPHPYMQTGTSDIPLTQQGVELISGLAPKVVGDGSRSPNSLGAFRSRDAYAPLVQCFSTPRTSSTFTSLLASVLSRHTTFCSPMSIRSPRCRSRRVSRSRCSARDGRSNTTRVGVREWTYGDYEGKTSGAIKEERGKKWDIVSLFAPRARRAFC